MKGILLAGGNGTRLGLLTRITNKHLLPVAEKPMVLYPLNTLKNMGVDEVLVVSGGEHLGAIEELLQSGREFGIDITYKVQEEAGGIAQALGLAKSYVGRGKFAAILGDNIFEEHFFQYAVDFEKNKRSEARVFLKKVSDANRFGVPVIKDGRIVRVVEKPNTIKEDFAVTGLYMYDHKVFDIISKLRPSARKELEISDVNNTYAKRGSLEFHVVQGHWTDAGTPESLYRATTLVRGLK